EHLDVVVVDRSGLGEDLFAGHGRQQLRLGDAPRPFLAQLRAVLPQVGHQLTEQRRGLAGRENRVVWRFLPAFRVHHVSASLQYAAPEVNSGAAIKRGAPPPRTPGPALAAEVNSGAPDRLNSGRAASQSSRLR